MDGQPPPESIKSLPSDASNLVIREAKKEGLFAGLTSGLVSALIGQRLMGFDRKKTLVSGVLGAVLAGYYFTQAFTSTAIAQLHAEEARIQSAMQRPGNSGTPTDFQDR